MEPKHGPSSGWWCPADLPNSRMSAPGRLLSIVLDGSDVLPAPGLLCGDVLIDEWSTDTRRSPIISSRCRSLSGVRPIRGLPQSGVVRRLSGKLAQSGRPGLQPGTLDQRRPDR